MDADPEVRTVTVDPVADPPTDGDEAGEVTVGPGAARRLRITSALMVVALVALAASTVLFTLPVTNPGVQSCGSPAWFLLQAESDAPLVDPDGQPLNGWDTERIQEADDNRCSVLVAQRAVPAGVLLVVFWALTGTAVVLGWTTRRGLRRVALDRAEMPGQPTS